MNGPNGGEDLVHVNAGGRAGGHYVPQRRCGDIPMSDQCDRCGRTDAVFGVVWKKTYHGSRETVLLCHGNPDGSKVDPDCYHIVTTR